MPNNNLNKPPLPSKKNTLTLSRSRNTSRLSNSRRTNKFIPIVKGSFPFARLSNPVSHTRKEKRNKRDTLLQPGNNKGNNNNNNNNFYNIKVPPKSNKPIKKKNNVSPNNIAKTQERILALNKKSQNKRYSYPLIFTH